MTRVFEPALRYTLAASRQGKLGQVADSSPVRLVADAKSLSVRRQAAAHAAEASRRNVPGTPWVFVKVGTTPPRLVRPEAYDGASFSAILDAALGR